MGLAFKKKIMGFTSKKKMKIPRRMLPESKEAREDEHTILGRLYIRLSLHSYCIFLGEKLQFGSIERYFKTRRVGCAYSINLKAKDDPDSRQPLQPVVFEGRYGKFLLTCRIVTSSLGCGEMVNLHNNLGDIMPVLPPENPFLDDTGRFYLLTRSSFIDNEWIGLYLELAIATTNRKHLNHGLTTHLKILKVAMENTPDKEGLGIFDATFYIRYKDTCKDRVGEDVDRVAIVRRILNVQLKSLTLFGHTLSSHLPWEPVGHTRSRRRLHKKTRSN